MTDRLFHNYLSKRSPPEMAASTTTEDIGLVSEIDSTEDLGCFGHLRGIRDRAIMLELRKRDGSIMAIAYTYIERAEFDPSDGITLHALGRQIKITGLHLNGHSVETPTFNTRPPTQARLFHSITRHRVSWIQEADTAAKLTADHRATQIDSITW